MRPMVTPFWHYLGQPQKLIEDHFIECAAPILEDIVRKKIESILEKEFRQSTEPEIVTNKFDSMVRGLETKFGLPNKNLESCYERTRLEINNEKILPLHSLVQEGEAVDPQEADYVEALGKILDVKSNFVDEYGNDINKQFFARLKKCKLLHAIKNAELLPAIPCDIRLKNGEVLHYSAEQVQSCKWSENAHNYLRGGSGDLYITDTRVLFIDENSGKITRLLLTSIVKVKYEGDGEPENASIIQFLKESRNPLIVNITNGIDNNLCRAVLDKLF